MKFLNILLLSVYTSGLALAAPPQLHRADRYKDLYLNSPMTDPPVIEVPPEEISDLPDWVLVGVTKYVNSTRVTIMNIKDRTRVEIPSKEASELGFAVKEVVQDRNYLDHTVVTLQKGKDTGEVRFDPKFLVLKKVAGPTASKGARPGTTKKPTITRNGTQPPTPPGVRTTAGKTGTRATPAKPGAVPQPTTSRATTTSTTAKPASTSTSTQTKRTRYVPRPKK